MTVISQETKVIYEGNGLTREWPFSFPIMNPDTLKVFISRPDGGTDQVEKADYVVDQANKKVIYPKNDLAEPLGAGKKIILARQTPITQELELVNNGVYYAETVEVALDQRTFVEQEISEQLERAVKVPIGEANPEEFGQGVLDARDRAERAATEAEQAKDQANEFAGQAHGSANQAIEAKNEAQTAQAKAEQARDQAEAAMDGKLAFGDLKAGNNMVITQEENGKVTFSATTGGGGGGAGTVTSVANQLPDEFGNVDLKPTHIGAVTQTEYNTAMADKADKIHTHPEANDSEAGFMSAEDKTKLDTYAGIESGNAGKSLIVNGAGTGTEWAVVSGVPVGTIIAWGGLTPPAGYLECTGQLLNRVIYVGLFSAIGTVWGTTASDNFKLPDFKSAARFLRSRGDGLEVGMTQEDAIRNITGASGVIGSAEYSRSGSGAGAMKQINGGNSLCNSVSNVPSPSIVFDASLVVPTANENRPKNAVVMYCIKATDEYINPSQVDMASVAETIAGKAGREEIKELAGTRLWVSGEYMPIANQATMVLHGLPGIDPLRCRCDVLLICKVAEHGYSVGDQAISWGAYTGFGANPTTAHLSNTTIQYNTGNQQTGLYGCNKNTGFTANFRLENWCYIFRIWY